MSNLDDLRVMISHSPGASLAVFGALSSPCLLDFEGRGWGPEGWAQIGVETITCTFVYPDLPGLMPGSAITVDGVPYVVSAGPRRKADGLEAVVILEAA